ncbi:MAG: winged helix-turn-helix domain-containing protein [Pseudomonadales bacterium]
MNRADEGDGPESLEPSPRVRFGEFELDRDSFELLRNGEPVHLEPRVLLLLGFLIERRSQLVSKDVLLDELWGHRFVSETALATQIKRLRQALGDDGRRQEIIKTVHGRGYRFVAEIENVPSKTVSTAKIETLQRERTSNLGYERTPFFGRGRELRRCIEALGNFRMVSLLGIGGTGKTRLAKAVGRAVLEQYPDGVWFVDLVPVTDADGIDAAMASVLGLQRSGGSTRERLADVIRDRNALFILDNCEHIEDDVAEAVDFFLEHTVAPRFLITSRDPIDLADELRFFVEPLALESDQGESPAVQLFVETARRHGMTDLNFDLAKVKQACARLDGLPLAIELAAAQLKHLTLDELLVRLDRRFDLLAGRQRVRTGADRQDSLAAVVRETWDLLNGDEKRLLEQMAAFPDQFTMADVEEVCPDQMTQSISFSVSRLVELCLLSRTTREGPWWRLLETVRLYALEQLSPEARLADAERHARWCLERLGEYPHGRLLSYAHAQWAADHYPDLEAAERFFRERGDIRTAIDICAGPQLMIQLDLGSRALAKLDDIDGYLEATDEVSCRAELHAMAALCALITRKPDLFVRHAESALETARELGDPARLTVALILASLTNNFSDPEKARHQIDEALQAANQAGDPGSRDLAGTYLAWHLAMQQQYEEAADVAAGIAETNLTAGNPIDHPTYSAICAVIARRCFDDPGTANTWTDRLLETDQTHSLFGAASLFACARAAGGHLRQAAEMCNAIVSQLARLRVEPWPDLYVPLATIAYADGQTEQAQLWLRAIRASKTPLKTFHCIAVYQQLRSKLGLGASAAEDHRVSAEIGAEALEWLGAF